MSQPFNSQNKENFQKSFNETNFLTQENEKLSSENEMLILQLKELEQLYLQDENKLKKQFKLLNERTRNISMERLDQQLLSQQQLVTDQKQTILELEKELELLLNTTTTTTTSKPNSYFHPNNEEENFHNNQKIEEDLNDLYSENKQLLTQLEQKQLEYSKNKQFLNLKNQRQLLELKTLIDNETKNQNEKEEKEEKENKTQKAIKDQETEKLDPRLKKRWKELNLKENELVQENEYLENELKEIEKNFTSMKTIYEETKLKQEKGGKLDLEILKKQIIQELVKVQNTQEVLEKEGGLIKERLKKVQTKVVESENILKKQEKQLEEVAQSIELDQKAIKEMKNEHQTLLIDLESRKNSFKQLQNEYLQRNSILIQLKKECDELESIFSKNKELRLQKDTLSNEIGKLDKMIEKKTKDYKSLELQFGDLQKKCDNQKMELKEIELIQENKLKIENEIITEKEINEKLQNKFNFLKNQNNFPIIRNNKSNDDEDDNVDDENDDFNGSVAKNESQLLRELVFELQDLERQTENKKKELETIQLDVKELVTDLNSFLGDYKGSMQKEIERRVKLIEQMKQYIDEKQQEFELKKNNLNNLTEQNRKLRIELGIISNNEEIENKNIGKSSQIMNLDDREMIGAGDEKDQNLNKLLKHNSLKGNEKTQSKTLIMNFSSKTQNLKSKKQKNDKQKQRSIKKSETVLYLKNSNKKIQIKNENRFIKKRLLLHKNKLMLYDKFSNDPELVFNIEDIQIVAKEKILFDKKYCFQINTNDSHYIFSVNSLESQQNWIKVIQKIKLN
ncbi:hypothetical protein M0813_06015 [Anaeramoeba flamelloides]|uniref:PH domain-containing protein n=1 Tax=Anaeramoeba flamelloides TaxID=1746091 RepID=A0ABQ8XFP0_9EUKA|nr:hypothetical protein M0813_06015 [Anaeramoeba flamelloides]